MQALQVRILSIVALFVFWAAPALAEDAAVATVDTSTGLKQAGKLQLPPKGPLGALPTAKTKDSTATGASPTPAATASGSVHARPRPIPRMDRSARPSHHLVRTGDWLSKIAVRYGMSVEEIIALNGLPDDGIDVGQKLRLRGQAAAPAMSTQKGAAVPAPRTTSSPLPVVELPPTPPTTASNPAPALSVQNEPEQTIVKEDQGAGLTAKELVASERPRDEIGDPIAAISKANVEIPTLSPPSVNPLSRARVVLAISLLVLGLLILHPRSRSLIADRLPLGLRKSKGGEPGHAIEMHAVRRLGGNQQILFFEVFGTRLLVGVSDGRMDLLHRWNGDNDQVQAVDSPVAVEPSQEAGLASLDSASTPTRRTAAISQQQVDQADAPPKLTPSAEQLLDSWRETSVGQRSPQSSSDENPSWWMEGATHRERNRLSGDEPGADTADNLDGQRGDFEESILATLRNRRSEVPSNVQASRRGTQQRPAAQSGGFRAAARLGRRPLAGSQNPRPSTEANTTDEASSAKAKQRTGGNFSFQL